MKTMKIGIGESSDGVSKKDNDIHNICMHNNNRLDGQIQPRGKKNIGESTSKTINNIAFDKFKFGNPQQENEIMFSLVVI